MAVAVKSFKIPSYTILIQIDTPNMTMQVLHFWERGIKIFSEPKSSFKKIST